MAQEGVLGNGTKIGYSATSPVTYVAIGQLASIDNIPGFAADEIDTTISSTSKLKRAMPGLIAVDNLEFTLLADLDPATDAALEALRGYNQSQETIWWRIEIPTDRQQTEFRGFEFQGWVKTWKPIISIPDRQTIKITVRFDGDGIAIYDPGASEIT